MRTSIYDQYGDLSDLSVFHSNNMYAYDVLLSVSSTFRFGRSFPKKSASFCIFVVEGVCISRW